MSVSGDVCLRAPSPITIARINAFVMSRRFTSARSVPSRTPVLFEVLNPVAVR